MYLLWLKKEKCNAFSCPKRENASGAILPDDTCNRQLKKNEKKKMKKNCLNMRKLRINNFRTYVIFPKIANCRSSKANVKHCSVQYVYVISWNST